MADTEEIIGQTKDGRIILAFTDAGDDSYPTGGMTVTITKLKEIEKVVSIENNKGYMVSPGSVSVSNNALTVPVYYHYYQCPVTCPTGAREVNNGTDLSGVSFTGVVIGR